MNKDKLYLMGALALLAGAYVFTSKADKGNTMQEIAREKPQSYNYTGNVASTSKNIKTIPMADIVLNSDNSVLFRSEVTTSSVAKAEVEIMNKAAKLRGKPLYLVLDTPGGDISAGYDLIDFIRGTHANVQTITQFSASMGAYIAESLGTRYVTAHGTYMFHRAKVEGVGGQIPGELLTRTGYLLNMVTVMEKQNAGRLGISMEEYTKLVKDEYWVTGEEAVKQGSADYVANIQCDASLNGTFTEQAQVFIFTLNVTYSRCPAIRGPLSVQMVNPSPDQKENDRIIQDFIYRTDKSKTGYLE